MISIFKFQTHNHIFFIIIKLAIQKLVLLDLRSIYSNVYKKTLKGEIEFHIRSLETKTHIGVSLFLSNISSLFLNVRYI